MKIIGMISGRSTPSGREYALAPDSPAKEAYLLTLLEAFHSYMSKYLVMIVRGTIPNGNSDAR
jgi:hypothetical protein